MIQIPWPQQYLALLETVSFVNIDVVSLLGFKCVNNDLWDFRGRLLLACFVPPLVCLTSLLVYKCRNAHVQKRSESNTASMKEMTMHSVEYLWDMFDEDGILQIVGAFKSIAGTSWYGQQTQKT
jgi:hypothetical protein